MVPAFFVVGLEAGARERGGFTPGRRFSGSWGKKQGQILPHTAIYGVIGVKRGRILPQGTAFRAVGVKNKREFYPKRSILGQLG